MELIALKGRVSKIWDHFQCNHDDVCTYVFWFIFVNSTYCISVLRPMNFHFMKCWSWIFFKCITLTLVMLLENLSIFCLSSEIRSSWKTIFWFSIKIFPDENPDQFRKSSKKCHTEALLSTHYFLESWSDEEGISDSLEKLLYWHKTFSWIHNFKDSLL